MAAITLRGDSQWQVKWRLRGTSTWQTCTFDDQKVATRAKVLAEAHQHRITKTQVYELILGLPDDQPGGRTAEDGKEPTVPSVSECGRRYFDVKADVQNDTLEGYIRTFHVLLEPEFGHLQIDAVDRDEHIKPWIKRLSRKYAPRTVHRYFAPLHQLFAWAAAKYNFENPCEPCPGQKTIGLPKILAYDAVFLNPHEAAIVINACDPAIRTMAVVALGTGLRWGEIVALRQQDLIVYGSDVRILVRQARKSDGTVGQPKSTASLRTVTTSDRIATILERQRQGLKRPTDLLFTTSSDKMWHPSNFRNRYWLPALAKAQRCRKHPPPRTPDRRGRIHDDPLAVSTCTCETRLQRNVRFHDLRHTHVGNLIEAKWDLYAIQIRIGHESIKTTFDVYGHLRSMGDTEQLGALDKYLPEILADDAESG